MALVLVAGAAFAADKEASFEPGVLVGQVVADGDHAPLAQAKVFLLGSVARRGRSDKEGRFRFEGLAPGHYKIWAYKGNLTTQKESIEGRREAGYVKGRIAPLVLTPKPGKQIRVNVTSTVTHQPLEGARIRLRDYPDEREQMTAKNGTATIDGLLPQKYEATVEARDHGHLYREIDLTRSGDVTDVPTPLSAGGVVHGTVTDEQGQPLRGVSVYYVDDGGTSGYFGESHRTDAKGAYRNIYIPVNTSVRVSVDKSDYVSQEKTITLQPAKRDLQLDFKLVRRAKGGSIAGVVKDEKGNPISGATIVNFGKRSYEKRQATTDKAGRFRIDDVLEMFAGPEIVVRANGFSPKVQPVEPGPADKPKTVAVVLAPGHLIHGRIVTEKGKPLKNVSVSVSGGLYSNSLATPRETDDDGRFEMDSLPSDCRFDIYKSGYSTLQDVALKLDATGIATVVMQPMGILRGRVVDAEIGKPVEHFNVRIGFTRERRPLDINASYKSTLANPGVTFESKEGTFTLNELANRMALELTVQAEGYLKAVVPRVVVATADQASFIDVSLKRLDPKQLAVVSGRIVDHTGRGVPGTNLRLIVSTERSDGPYASVFNWYLIKSGQLGNESMCDQFLTTASDSQGRFEFKNILPDKFLQLAYWGDHVPQGRTPSGVKTRPGTTQTWTVQLPAPARIVATLDRAKYPTAREVHVGRANSVFETYETKLSPGQTKVEFNDLPPSQYVVKLNGPPVRLKDQPRYFMPETLNSKTVQLKAGETKDVAF